MGAQDGDVVMREAGGGERFHRGGEIPARREVARHLDRHLVAEIPGLLHHVVHLSNIANRRLSVARAPLACGPARCAGPRSEEHTSELQSLMRISYAVFCLKKKTKIKTHTKH